MTKKTTQSIVDKIQSALSSFEKTREVSLPIMSGVETLAEDNQKLEEENRKLKNEINKLKGETIEPKIRKQRKDKSNHSSESERKRQKKKNKRKNGVVKSRL